MSRQRHAFLIPFDEFEESVNQHYSFHDGEVKVTDLSSPRHDRVTIPESIQPHTLKQQLQDKKLQISWSSYSNFSRNVPFKLVQEPGFHVESSLDLSWDDNNLESVIKTIFGENSHSSVSFNQSAYVETPNWRSFYTPLATNIVGDDGILADYFHPQELQHAKSIFISYGSTPISANANQLPSDIFIEVYWEDRPAESIIKKATRDSKTEVGLFTLDPAYNRDGTQFGLSGLIRNLDKKQFDKTLFYIHSKHRYQPSGGYSAAFHTPLGLHPKHVLTLDSLEHPPHSSCKLYSKYTIPKSLFLDQYQLADLERSNAATSATGKLIGVWGETNLEAPVWSVDGWGSEAVVQIFTHDRTAFDFELPMHSRYEVPLENTTQVERDLPWPVVFWACQDDEKDEKAYPEIEGLGYGSLFPDDTLFYHLNPQTQLLSSSYHIPVAPSEKYNIVHSVTVAVILGGVLWIVMKTVLNVFNRSSPRRQQQR